MRWTALFHPSRRPLRKRIFQSLENMRLVFPTIGKRRDPAPDQIQFFFLTTIRKAVTNAALPNQNIK